MRTFDVVGTVIKKTVLLRLWSLFISYKILVSTTAPSSLFRNGVIILIRAIRSCPRGAEIPSLLFITSRKCILIVKNTALFLVHRRLPGTRTANRFHAVSIDVATSRSFHVSIAFNLLNDSRIALSSASIGSSVWTGCKAS